LGGKIKQIYFPTSAGRESSHKIIDYNHNLKNAGKASEGIVRLQCYPFK
jgi:hypothetical protein